MLMTCEFSGSVDGVIQKLENDSRILMNWFKINYLKPNLDKWHLLLREDITISVGKIFQIVLM